MKQNFLLEYFVKKEIVYEPFFIKNFPHKNKILWLWSRPKIYATPTLSARSFSEFYMKIFYLKFSKKLEKCISKLHLHHNFILPI